MCAEFCGVPEKIHGVIASHFLCYQRLVGGQKDKTLFRLTETKGVKETRAYSLIKLYALFFSTV